MSKTTCLVCGQKFIDITWAHLKTHNLTPTQYLEKYSKAKLVSEESKTKRSKTLLKYYKECPEAREKLSKSHIKYYEEHPETKEKQSKDMKILFSTPDFKKKFKEAHNNPETREKRKIRMINDWKNPNSNYNSKERKEKSSKSQIKRWKDPKEKEKVANTMKEKWKDPEYRERVISGNTGKKQSNETRKKISEKIKAHWQNPEYAENIIKKSLKSLLKRPTQLETAFCSFFEKNNIPLNYCGDGSLIIGRKCPDFVENNGRKIVAEVANKVDKTRSGRKYNKWQEYEQERIEHFEKHNWKCLVLWDDELNDKKTLLGKINNFMNFH